MLRIDRLCESLLNPADLDPLNDSAQAPTVASKVSYIAAVPTHCPDLVECRADDCRRQHNN